MHSSHKRIAKNTLYMYGRMLLLMAVTLYTSRIVLNALGVVDFGIFNVVGGVVAFIGFLNSSLTSSTQRFLNVEMGQGTAQSLNKTFCQAINAHVVIGLVTVIFLETVGLWFVTEKLVIPSEQRIAALWVYQCAIAIFFISIISAPYNAAIVANEKMSIFAGLSILEAGIKLGVAFMIKAANSHRLIYYAVMLLGVALIMRFTYSTVCLKKFPECRYRFSFDRKVMRGMFSFAGWMIFGTLSDVLAGQGVNMLINIFFGPVLNAARAIAVQVQSAVSQLASNFMISVNPQIVKLYAGGEHTEAYKLVFQTSKLSFFLMLMLVIPISVKAHYILHLWLKEVPEYAPLFVQLILLEYLFRSSYTPIAQINVAYGKVRLYQIVIASLFLLTFIGTYGLFKVGLPVYTTYILSAAIAVVGLFVRLLVLRRQNRFPMTAYLRKVSLPILGVLLLTMVPSYWGARFFPDSFIWLVVCILSVWILTGGIIWTIGLTKSERTFITVKVSGILNRLKLKS